MIAFSAAVVVVAILAYLSVRDWLALQRKKHEDSVSRVVSAEEVAQLKADLDSVKRQFNGIAMRLGMQGFPK